MTDFDKAVEEFVEALTNLMEVTKEPCVTIAALDQQIEEKLSEFLEWFA